jgi:hypothetical protein
MKSKLNLMTALVGLAMLATPIAAAAKDHRGPGNFSRPAQVRAQARAFNPPARAFVTNRPFRNRAVFVPAPVVRADPDRWGDRHEWKHGPDGDGDADDYVRYGRGGGYYVAPAPVVAPYYAGPGYVGGYGGGRSCAQARRVMTVYQQDRYRGHPAAAADILRQNQWAFRSGCGGVAPIGGGLFNNGFGGFGNGFGAAPVYNNYGGGYGQPYGAGYGGYNGGYGQPYGGGLGGLLQQFVH